ncbi:cytochrome b/b6 domain-containing protein [Tabrizicola sp.]|uniref:cytochrome b n=1 Tax=Tabrizicola sp. TaxID=2005166 RepID=UPI00286B4BF1|nr:cytochrome b/b6 domain-containing protein [Tabrizicola sp.]
MPARYARALVVLHWLIASLVLLGLIGGTFFVDEVPNSDPAKIGALAGHMIIGGAILVLMLVRLIIRLRADVPPSVNAASTAAHWGLYLLVFVMAGSGITMSLAIGLPNIVFFGQGSLPADFNSLTARTVHGIAANLLIALVALHVAAAIWHAAVKTDGVMARMGLRR